MLYYTMLYYKHYTINTRKCVMFHMHSYLLLKKVAKSMYYNLDNIYLFLSYHRAINRVSKWMRPNTIPGSNRVVIVMRFMPT